MIPGACVESVVDVDVASFTNYIHKRCCLVYLHVSDSVNLDKSKKNILIFVSFARFYCCVLTHEIIHHRYWRRHP
jgi:hypothetical protein